MKRFPLLLLTVLSLLLSGCASTIRSNVTIFQAWPADLTDKSYVFERSQVQDQSLEYRTYENMVRNEVRRLGWTEAESGKPPNLTVTLDYGLQTVEVKAVEPVYADPYYDPYFFNRGFYPRRRFGGFDPFFWGPPAVTYQERHYQVYRRQLHLLVRRHADGKMLYDVRVTSQGDNPSLAAVMPYLVRSALADFPGQNGVTRTIDLKIEN